MGKRFRVTLTAHADLITANGILQLNVQWAPAPPTRLSKSEMRQYRAGRDRFVARLAAVTGQRTALVEV